MKINMKRYIITLSYIGMIVSLNTLFLYLPFVSAFSEHFSLADLFVGAIYIVRDFAQRELQHRVLVAMLIGVILSYILATPEIALASACAFLVGELIDWAIFTFSKKPLSQRLLSSSLISSPFDTLVFLGVAGRLHPFEFAMMTFGKFLGVFILWLIWKIKTAPKTVPQYSNQI